jgi:branched-chain amino acid transport system substrate-binding protein
VKRCAALLLLLAALAAGCNESDDPAAVPVASSACTEILSEGDGKPDAIVVSDLARRGIGGETARLMDDAIKLVLRQRGFRAGKLKVGYQSCNDTIGEEPFDEGRCEANARDYVEAEDVLGIIGPWNSGCAAVQLPILSRRAAGPLAIVSPANTYVGLTRRSPGADREHPAALYPDGVRNYVRMVATDVTQGAAGAVVARDRGATRAVVLVQRAERSYSFPLARSFARQARASGLVVSTIGYDAQPAFGALARRVAGRRPEAVYIAGLQEGNGRRLVQDLRAALGSGVLLIAPDGFRDDVALGSEGTGLRYTAVGVPAELLPPAGKRFLKEFGQPPFAERGFLGAPEAAQAAEVLLDAIAASDGTRASVVDRLFETKVSNGILGSFRFDRRGDIVPGAVGVYRFEKGKEVVDGVVRPD